VAQSEKEKEHERECEKEKETCISELKKDLKNYQCVESKAKEVLLRKYPSIRFSSIAGRKCQKRRSYHYVFSSGSLLL